MALVTSKSDWLASRALEFLGLNELFSVLVGCDTCVNHKPHPEPVERALTLLGVPNSAAILSATPPTTSCAAGAAGVGTHRRDLGRLRARRTRSQSAPTS